MLTSRKRSGNKAEDAALAAARERGLKLVERNYLTRRGELDLLLTDGDSLIVAEVRYRARSDFGSAAESVTLSKQRRIIAATKGFLLAQPQWNNAPVRFDVIALDAQGNLDWIENAFFGE